MAAELDRTQQRIIGVLIEKELAVPESYPLTENALIAACNQKSNRNPEMSLEQFEVNGAMNALMTADWAKSTSSTGGHATRYAHRLESQFTADDREKAILCELLIRGPQAPGALKPRVARLGFSSNAVEIETILRGLAGRPAPMVEQLPKRPRERDHRWRQLLGPMDPAHEVGGGVVVPGATHAPAAAAPTSVPAPGSSPAPADAAGRALELRIEQLEADVAELRAALAKLRET